MIWKWKSPLTARTILTHLILCKYTHTHANGERCDTDVYIQDCDYTTAHNLNVLSNENWKNAKWPIFEQLTSENRNRTAFAIDGVHYLCNVIRLAHSRLKQRAKFTFVARLIESRSKCSFRATIVRNILEILFGIPVFNFKIELKFKCHSCTATKYKLFVCWHRNNQKNFWFNEKHLELLQRAKIGCRTSKRRPYFYHLGHIVVAGVRIARCENSNSILGMTFRSDLNDPKWRKWKKNSFI